jgi:hypothetical protein
MGRLLAVAPRLGGHEKQFLRNLVECFRAFPNNRQTPPWFKGFSNPTPESQYLAYKPKLIEVLEVCYIAGVNIATLFTSTPQMLLDFDNSLAAGPGSGAEIKSTLERALTEVPTPSLCELARRLGTYPKELKNIAPELSSQIISAYQAGPPHPRDRRFRRAREVELKKMKRALEAELKKTEPEPISKIASRIGQTRPDKLAYAYPKLCAKIVRKIERPNRAFLHRVEEVLKHAERERPIPPLSTLAKRLGLTGTTFLRGNFPAVIIRLEKIRRQQQREILFKQKETLLKIVKRADRMTLKEVEQEMQLTADQMRLRFPRELALVISHIERRRFELFQKRRKKLEDFVYRLVQDNLKVNHMPTSPEIKAKLPDGYLRSFTAINRALNAIRDRLCNEMSGSLIC